MIRKHQIFENFQHTRANLKRLNGKGPHRQGHIRGRLGAPSRLLLSHPGGGGGLVWPSARSQPPTHPPTQPYPPPRGGGPCPMPSTCSHIQAST